MHRLGRLISACFCLIFVANAAASSPSEVAQELTKLDRWLAPSIEAAGWNEYLHLDALRTQLALGDAADGEEVAKVLNRFQLDRPALQTPEFVRFAGSLKAWHQRLVQQTAAPPQQPTSDSAPTDTQHTLITAIGPAPTQQVPAVPDFQPISDAQVNLAREQAQLAISQLDSFLARGPKANADAWKNYLGWSQVQAQLTPQGEPDVAVLGKTIAQYYSGESGLELPQFVAAREALLRYHRILTAKSNEGITATYQQQVQDVIESLQQPTSDATDLATRVNWLEQLGQAPSLVAHARDSYGHPNLHFSATADTIARRFAEPVSRTTQVNDMILGTHVRGTAQMNGTVTASLIPSNQNALLQLTLTGTTHSNTLGWQRPVSISSRGVTSVSASKLVVLDLFGLRAGPATACCKTRTTICGISAGNRLGKRLIERIAWKRAGQSKGAAENVASRKAEARVARQFDESTTPRMADANYRLENEVRRPLKKRNLYPRLVSLWTTSERLNFSAVQALESQLAAPGMPPAAPGSGITLQIHESMVLNSAVNAMGGLKLTDERAQALAEEATGSVPEELRIKQDEDPWSITFDVAKPVRVAFDDNKVTIAIRGREFTRGGDAIRKIAEIGATYAPQILDGRLKLVRVGDVDVVYPGKEGKRLSLTELRNKTFLINKFEGIFKSELGGDELNLQGELTRLKDVQLTHVTADDGWLSLGWD